MKKFALFVLSVIVLCSCSKSDEVIETPIVEQPCRYDLVLNKVDNPILSTVDNERIIEFIISNFEPMLLNEPSVSNTIQYFDYKIAESEFRKYQSHFTSVGYKSTDRIYKGKMQNGDYFKFDYKDTKQTHNIIVQFHCIHIN